MLFYLYLIYLPLLLYIGLSKAGVEPGTFGANDIALTTNPRGSQILFLFLNFSIK